MQEKAKEAGQENLKDSTGAPGSPQHDADYDDNMKTAGKVEMLIEMIDEEGEKAKRRLEERADHA